MTTAAGAGVRTLALRGTAMRSKRFDSAPKYLFSSGGSERVPVAPDRLSPDGSGSYAWLGPMMTLKGRAWTCSGIDPLILEEEGWGISLRKGLMTHGSSATASRLSLPGPSAIYVAASSTAFFSQRRPTTAIPIVSRHCWNLLIPIGSLAVSRCKGKSPSKT